MFYKFDIFILLYDLNKRFTRITRVISFDLRLNDACRRGVSSRLRCLIIHGVHLMNTTTIRASTTHAVLTTTKKRRLARKRDRFFARTQSIVFKRRAISADEGSVFFAAPLYFRSEDRTHGYTRRSFYPSTTLLFSADCVRAERTIMIEEGKRGIKESSEVTRMCISIQID